MADKCETVYELINILGYGQDHAMSSVQIFNKVAPKMPLDAFQRLLRNLAHEARMKGHQIISGANGYYKAVSKHEWESYKIKRFAAIRDELQSIASCDRISMKDLIKFVYSVNVDDQNYTFNF